MKINGRHEAEPTRPASHSGRFQAELKKAAVRGQKPPPPGGTPPRSLPISVRGVTMTRGTRAVARTPGGGALASAEHLGQVRQGASAEVHRLRDVRVEAHQTQQERVHQRVAELIARELAREPTPGSGMSGPAPGLHPRPAEAHTPGAAEGPGASPVAAREGVGGARTQGLESPSAEARVQATLELIEKLELFVKSQRPALSLQLGGGWDARVEVERTGPGEVALRIQGQRGPLAQKDLDRIREALGTRGLKLSALLAS